MANTNSVFTDLSSPDGVADALAAGHSDLPLSALRLLACDRDSLVAENEGLRQQTSTAVARMHAAYAAQESAEKALKAEQARTLLLLNQADARELALVQAKEEIQRLQAEVTQLRTDLQFRDAADLCGRLAEEESDYFGVRAEQEQERRDAIAAHSAPIGARDLVSPEAVRAWFASMASEVA